MDFKRSVLVFAATFAAAVAVGAAETDWTMAGYDEGHSGYTPQQLGSPLTLSWQYDAPKYADNRSTPAVSNGVVYYAAGNKVFALESASGALQWQYPSVDTGMKCNIKTGITVWENKVIFGGTDGNLYALSAQDGHMLWTYPTGASIRSTPTVSSGYVYFGSDDNNLYCIDVETGESIWVDKKKRPAGFRTGDDVQSTPAIAAGTVIFISMDTNVYAANSATGAMKWSCRLPLSPVKTFPVVSGTLVYVSCGSNVYVLNAKTGQIRYTITLPSDAVAAPAVAGSDLYIMCRNRKLYAYTVGMATPKLKWAEPVTVGMVSVCSPMVAGDTVYVATNKGAIIGYSAADGHLVWRYTLAPSLAGNNNQGSDFTDVSAQLAAADGALFAVADDGALRCFRPNAPDNTAPKIYNVVPEPGTVMSGSPPIDVSAILYDESTGINPDSIVVKIDDDPVEHTFDPATLTLKYQMPVERPIRMLRDGRHTVTVSASDWKGNELVHTWSFIADKSLPPKQIPKALKNKIRDHKPAEDKSGQDTTPSKPGGLIIPEVPSTPTSPGGSYPPPPPAMPGRTGPGGPGTPPGPYSEGGPQTVASRATA